MPGYSCSAIIDKGIEEKLVTEKKVEEVRRPHSRGYYNYIKGAFDKKYDNHNNFHSDSLEELMSTTHKVYGHITIEFTEFSYQGGKTKKRTYERTMSTYGSAVVIENDGNTLKLVTCNHCVSLPKLPKINYANGKPKLRAKIKEKH